MTRYSAPPAALAQAIARSASKYLSGFPDGVALLTGIWRIESASTFPNPAVNSEGYGGLFGTTNWNGSTQAQADLAASILGRLLSQNGGNVAAALSAYSGGGYSSVAGVSSTATATTVAYQRTRPGAGTGQLADLYLGPFLPSIPGVPNVLSPLEKAFESVFSHLPFAGDVSGIVDFLKTALWLIWPKTWLRIVEALFGATLFFLGLAGLAVALLVRSKAAGEIAGAAAAAPGPVGTAGKAITSVRTVTRRRSNGGRRSSASSSARRSSSRPPDELAAARARTENERTKEVRARRRQRLEQARELRREREARERRAYYRGAADASR